MFSHQNAETAFNILENPNVIMKRVHEMQAAIDQRLYKNKNAEAQRVEQQNYKLLQQCLSNNIIQVSNDSKYNKFLSKRSSVNTDRQSEGNRMGLMKKKSSLGTGSIVDEPVSKTRIINAMNMSNDSGKKFVVKEVGKKLLRSILEISNQRSPQNEDDQALRQEHQEKLIADSPKKQKRQFDRNETFLSQKKSMSKSSNINLRPQSKQSVGLSSQAFSPKSVLSTEKIFDGPEKKAKFFNCAKEFNNLSQKADASKNANLALLKNLQEQNVVPIPILTRLDKQALNLMGYQLNDGLAISLGKTLQHIQTKGLKKQIKEAYFDNNGLKDSSLAVILRGLVDHLSLIRLYLSNNELGVMSIEPLLLILSKNKPHHINDLELHNITTQGYIIEQVLLKIVQTPYLRVLRISNINLSDSKTMNSLILIIKKCENLRELDLQWLRLLPNQKLIKTLDVIAPKKFLLDHDFLLNNQFKKEFQPENNAKPQIKLLETEQEQDLDLDSFQIMQESKIINTHIMDKINIQKQTTSNNLKGNHNLLSHLEKPLELSRMIDHSELIWNMGLSYGFRSNNSKCNSIFSLNYSQNWKICEPNECWICMKYKYVVIFYKQNQAINQFHLVSKERSQQVDNRNTQFLKTVINEQIKGPIISGTFTDWNYTQMLPVHQFAMLLDQKFKNNLIEQQDPFDVMKILQLDESISNTIYINFPVQNDVEYDDAIGQDLYVFAGFMKPGKQTILIRDMDSNCYFSKSFAVELRSHEIITQKSLVYLRNGKKIQCNLQRKCLIMIQAVGKYPDSLKARKILFIATNVELVDMSENPDKELCRFEILEIFVRIAGAKYKDTGTTKTFSESLKMLLENHILPLCQTLNWQEFREKDLWTLDINDTFEANLEPLKKLFGQFGKVNKGFLNQKECINMIKAAGIEIGEKDIIFSYGMKQYNKMQFVEMLEFIARLGEQIFKNQPDLMLQEKIENVMDSLLRLVGMQRKQPVIAEYLESDSN
ncbi:UNKNOWN [Stylonychia lemnae]|uniref:Leucine rich repeat family protein n=1 Tax=Stylonychia lemnae TaxID=5949 RepID=A0A078AT11_STYLE|nr:UNKNOWN [Stylonychia lemnae]|eukprot:CDW83993.1 UNKNOWN [Stylonychia lemnae]